MLPFNVNINRIYPNRNIPQNGSIHALIETKDYNKVFCIGAGKTGTTSMKILLAQFGFKVGHQPTAEVLSRDWLKDRNAERIINYCYTADAFQDAPFRYPNLYKNLDIAFPKSKFVLTIRSSPEEWFESLKRFHTLKFSSDKSRLPSVEDLKNSLYRYKGYLFEHMMFHYNYPDIPLYDEKYYMRVYLSHNIDVQNYFSSRPNDLIIINLAIKKDIERLTSFLNITTDINEFPWENRTK